MLNETAHPTSAAMEPGGAYNRSSRVQSEGLAHALPLLEQAAQAVHLCAAPQPILIADYGSSEGRNSLVPMRTAIRALRERVGAERPVVVAHTDQASNDFTSLFRTLEHGPDSYLRGDPATFATAVGRSFYGQILPTGGVTLGWSSWAVQWLSRAPCAIPDQVQIAYSADLAAKAAFEQQAARDWECFLLSRSKELHPGGALVVLTMALTDDGDFGYRAIVEAIYGALRDMVQTGFLSESELRCMLIPTIGRSRAQLLAPFREKGTFASLRAQQAEVFLSRDWIWVDYEQNRDPALFGARWAAFNRASVFPTLALGLDPGDPARSAEFCDRLERAVSARLAETPAPTAIPLAQLLIVKEA